MKISQDDFASGVQSVSLELSTQEIRELIVALEALAAGELSHFHFRSDFSKPGIGDMAFSCSGDAETPDLTLEV